MCLFPGVPLYWAFTSKSSQKGCHFIVSFAAPDCLPATVAPPFWRLAPFCAKHTTQAHLAELQILVNIHRTVSFLVKKRIDIRDMRV